MNKRYFLSLIIFVLIYTPSAFASSDPGHVPSFSDITWFIVNFCLFGFAVWFFGRKNIAGMWEARRQTISDAVKKGENELKAAQKDLDEAKVKFANLSSDIEVLNNSIKAELSSEIKVIEEQSGYDVSRILEQATQEAEADKASNIRSVKEEIADILIVKAQERLKSIITEESDRNRRSKATSSLSKLIEM